MPQEPPQPFPGAPPHRLERGSHAVGWLIVGGGPHGCHLAGRLLGQPHRSGGDVWVLDPHREPLARWRVVTGNVGMGFLRSPVVHHIGGPAMDLARFADRCWAREKGRPFKGPYRRPSLALFNAHSAAVADGAGLAARWLRGRCVGLAREEEAGWRVRTDSGVIRARNVVLALGNGQALLWPEWARELRTRVAPGLICHVLDEEAEVGRPAPVPDLPVLVVGGGMSGTQLALRLARSGEAVVLATRAPTRVARFDADPPWLGPKKMTEFRGASSYTSRRRMIDGARNIGSVTSDVAHALSAMERRGGVTRVQAEILGAAPREGGIVVTLRESGVEGGMPRTLRVGRIVLATGFQRRRPGGEWLDAAIRQEGLPVAACGYPIPDAALRWAPGLFVMGALADLELGPVARNLAGARAAAERILALAGARGGVVARVGGAGSRPGDFAPRDLQGVEVS